ncbi:MAG TPA: TolC family protein [Polyangiaceae bacterium]|nr:TolC family protein [Polyangiaceae bacterium]
MFRSVKQVPLLLSCCLVARAASAQVLTLDEIESKAQRERSELVERQAAIEKAQAEVGLAQAKSGATIGARVEGSLSPGGKLVEIPVDLSNPAGDTYLVQGARALGDPDAFLPTPRYGAIFSGKMTLLDFGRSALGVKAAQAALGAERAALLQAKVELVRGARGAYLAWLEAYQNWQLARRDAEVTRQRTTNIKELISQGVRPATDATLSSYDEQVAGLRESRAARAASMALQVLAASVQSELPPSSTPDLAVLEAPPEAPPPAAPAGGKPAPQAPATSGPEAQLGALKLQRDAALSAARASDRGAAPVLDLGADLGVQGVQDHVFPVYKAGLSLSVPIWDGGVGKAQAAVHRAEARGLEARQQATERRIRAEQSAARERLQAAAEDLRLSNELLATAELMLTQAEEHYRAGSDTLERVLNAQRSLLQARREVLTAQLETARARLELTPIKVAP